MSTATPTQTRLSQLVASPTEPAAIARRTDVLPPATAGEESTGPRFVGSTEAVPHASGHSPQMGQIAEAMAAAQGEIKLAIANQEGVSKGKNSGVEFKFPYADLGAIIDVCSAPLSAHKIARFQPAKTLGNRVSVTTLLVHASGEWIAETLELPIDAGVMTTAQAVGAAISYARRYGLSALLGIGVADGEDVDAPQRANGNGHSSSVRPGGPVQMPQRQEASPPRPAAAAPAPSGPSRTAPPPAPGPQTPAGGFTIAAFERKRRTNGNGDYVHVQFSNGQIGSSVRPEMMRALEDGFKRKVRYADVVLTQSGQFAYVEELIPLTPGGDSW